MDTATDTLEAATEAATATGTTWRPDPTVTARIPSEWEGALEYYQAELRFAHDVDPTGRLIDLFRRQYAEHDLWFLLVFILRRMDVASHPWIFARCREVQASPDGHLDLWAREHYKSTIITFGHLILDIIRDREVTIGIFSHTRPVAKAFLRQIKREMETNPLLALLWPKTFWDNPQHQAPKWSEDDGLIVKRQGNPKESTLEAWGLVDGQPVGRHFRERMYDDIVVKESVQSSLMIAKTTEAWENSLNLGTADGIDRYAGTRWHLFDTYNEMIERGVVKPRIHPATINGKRDGEPVLWTPELWDAKKRAQKSVLNAQLLLSPLADGAATFSTTTLRGFQLRPAFLNVYITVDPSKGPQAARKDSDYTAMCVIGINAAGARYLIDGYYHRMRLSERWLNLRNLWTKWSNAPGVLACDVGYEQYGMQADIEYFNERMALDPDRVSFPITALAWPREGGASKKDRIERLEPWFEIGQFFLPVLTYHGLAPDLPAPASGETRWRYSTWFVDEKTEQVRFRGLLNDTRTVRQAKAEGRDNMVIYPIVRRDEEGQIYDVTQKFIAEFSTHPVSKHDDMLDCVSRVEDMLPVPAMIEGHQGALALEERPIWRD
jgi:hypothetical protein